jgi:acetyl-CoA carboxylase biotin carboxyl carrier protein
VTLAAESASAEKQHALRRDRRDHCDEFNIETPELKLSWRRTGAGAASPVRAERVAPLPARPASAPVAPQAPAAPTEKAALAAGQFEVVAPMVGTFYRAPSPEAPPFVEVGSLVEKGQALCLIEVMKLFTTIYAERAGRVVQIGPGNGDLVEFGQRLFVIEARD